MAAKTEPQGSKSVWRTIGLILVWIVVIVLATILLFAGYLWFWPIGLSTTPTPKPLAGYAEAKAAVDALNAQEAAGGVNPVCQTRLLDHGEKTAKAVVIFHGFANCPEQFGEIGQTLYDQGYNVLLARLPHHGLSDRVTEEPVAITAEEIAALANNMVDVAAGLGDEVTVVGFSGGGTTATWVAENRSDVARVVLISPLFGVQAFPAALTRPVSTAARTIIPNWWGWFDAEKMDKIEGPSYAYPRYSSRAMAEFLRLGQIEADKANSAPPVVKDVRLVGNLNDEMIRPEMYQEMVAKWEKQGAKVSVFEFPVSDGLKHDMIDPNQTYANTELVYPVVIDAITGS